MTKPPKELKMHFPLERQGAVPRDYLQSWSTSQECDLGFKLGKHYVLSQHSFTEIPNRTNFIYFPQAVCGSHLHLFCAVGHEAAFAILTFTDKVLAKKRVGKQR